MNKIFQTFIFPPHGLGDEIDILNRIIAFKLCKFKLEKTIIYELFNPFVPKDILDYELLDYEGQFITDDFFNWQHNFYKNDFLYNDVKQHINDCDKITKLLKQNTRPKIYPNFFKILNTRLNVKKDLNIYFVLINPMHEKKWQSIIIKGSKYQIITHENYLNFNNNYVLSKELSYKQIINDIKNIHQITNKNLIFIPAVIKHIFKEKKQKNKTGRYKIKMLEEDMNLLADMCILDNVYNSEHIPLEMFRKNYTHNSKNYITFSELAGSKNVNNWSHELFSNITNNVYEFNQTLSKAQYYFFYVFKESFNVDIKEIVNNNFLDLNVKFVPRINFMELYDLFKVILNSLFVVGAEGGHMHIALFAGVPYLLVIPNVFFTQIEKNSISPNFNEYNLIHVFTYIFFRFPTSKLFITTEEDINKDIKFVIEKMKYKVLESDITNVYANPILNHYKYDFIISQNKDYVTFIFNIIMKSLKLNHNNVLKN